MLKKQSLNKFMRLLLSKFDLISYNLDIIISTNVNLEFKFIMPSSKL